MTRFKNGLTTAAKNTLLGEFVRPSMIKDHTYFNDFDTFAAADWTITETQAGATQGLIDGDGGLLALVNTSADNDLNSIQLAKETFRFAAGKPSWFACRFKVSDATQSDVVIGMCITDTTPLDVTDGIYFYKADDAATITLSVEKDNTATTSSALATLADDTFITVGWYYDGGSNIEAYINDAKVATLATTNFPDDEDLTVTLAVQNGSAAARTLTVDYVLASKVR